MPEIPANKPPLELIDQSFEGRSALGTGVSAAIMRRVARGDLPPTARVHRTGRSLAFGRMDRLSPGYRDALAIAREHGYEPVERMAGGRAAVFHEGHDRLLEGEQGGGAEDGHAAALRGDGGDRHRRAAAPRPRRPRGRDPRRVLPGSVERQLGRPHEAGRDRPARDRRRRPCRRRPRRPRRRRDPRRPDPRLRRPRPRLGPNHRRQHRGRPRRPARPRRRAPTPSSPRSRKPSEPSSPPATNSATQPSTKRRCGWPRNSAHSTPRNPGTKAFSDQA